MGERGTGIVCKMRASALRQHEMRYVIGETCNIDVVVVDILVYLMRKQRSHTNKAAFFAISEISENSGKPRRVH